VKKRGEMFIFDISNWRFEFDKKTTRTSLWRLDDRGGRIEFTFDLKQFIFGANFFKRDIYRYISIFAGFLSFTYVRFLPNYDRNGKKLRF
jgi:hypothetical protein